MQTMLDPETILSPDESASLPWGAVLYEEQPAALPARIRPFIWALLLLRGEVGAGDVVAIMAPYVRGNDLRVGLYDDGDQTRLERIVDETIGDLVAQGLLRAAPGVDSYVLAPAGEEKAVRVACELNAEVPPRVLSQLALRGRPPVH